MSIGDTHQGCTQQGLCSTRFVHDVVHIYIFLVFKLFYLILIGLDRFDYVSYVC